MKSIDIEMVKLIHQLIAEESGGSVGVLNESLLDSALNSCFATFNGQDLYQTKEEKGARLGFNLVANHSLVDGNKRIGMHIMILFLELNGIYLNYSQEELVSLGVGVGSGEIKYEGILEWVKSHKIN